MNSDMTFKTSTTSFEATERLGARLANHLNGGEMIELSGDLGAGKTTFVRGLVHGLGFKGEVTSPTFTLNREYPVANGMTIHHFDMYRLQGHDIVTDELVEAMSEPDGITIVEWAQHADSPLKSDRLTVVLQYGRDESERLVEITAGGPISQQALEGLR